MRASRAAVEPKMFRAGLSAGAGIIRTGEVAALAADPEARRLFPGT
jgi:hypothetical protein